MDDKNKGKGSSSSGVDTMGEPDEDGVSLVVALAKVLKKY